jgi:hypothetical protein
MTAIDAMLDAAAELLRRLDPGASVEVVHPCPVCGRPRLGEQRQSNACTAKDELFCNYAKPEQSK